jgi:hypothetical protein
MKKCPTLIPAVVCLVVLTGWLNASGQTSFQKTYSNGEYLIGYDIGFYNGYYYITGASRTNTHSRLFLEKTNTYGDSIWNLYYNANTSLTGKKIISRNSDLYVAANNYSATGNTKGLLARIKENGDVIWSRTFGTTDSQLFNDAVMIDDSTIAVTGTITGAGAGGKDILVTLIDTSGLVKWFKTFGTTADEVGNAIIKTSDTSLVIAGTTNFQDPSGDMLVMKISMSGSFKWAKTYNLIFPDYPYYYSDQNSTDIMETITHFLVVAGSTKTGEFSPTDQQWSPVILKLGLDGSLIFCYDYTINSGNNQAYQILEIPDGSYVLLNSMSNDAWALLKTNTSGITDWCHAYGHSPFTFPANAVCGSGGAFVMTGSKNSQIDTVLFLVKTNYQGLSGCYDYDYSGYENLDQPVVNPITFSSANISGSSDFPLELQHRSSSLYIICETVTGVESKEETFTIYPNPVTDYLYLDKIPGIKDYTIQDCSGNKILYGDSKIVDLRKIDPGIYFLRVATDKGVFSFKVVKIER